MKLTSSAIIPRTQFFAQTGLDSQSNARLERLTYEMPNPPEVFVSYSSKDKKYKDDLLKQLKVLAQQGVISAWHDGLLVPGQQWNNEIVEHLNSSRVILLLISSDFLASDYVNNVELKMAAARHKKKEACVIPVLVRNVNSWQGYPFGDLKLGDLQAVPPGAKFIVDWDNRDKAFAEVANGIQRAVEQLKTDSEARLNPLIPPPPMVDFVARKGRDGNYIVERLKEELVRPNRRLVVLNGQGGVGKTTIAAEVARSLADIFADRIVWASAEKRADFTLSTLLDEIATQLGDPSPLTLAIEHKEEAVSALLTQALTLVVLDNFETVSPAEQAGCARYLRERAPCPSLITSRQQVPSTPSIPVDGMSPDEAEEFLGKLIAQMQDALIFSDSVRKQIIETAESRPYVMEWVVAQIDQRAEEPTTILKELSQGKGDAAERIFDHSFNLPQLGEDGRATLFALSLFVPSASRDALAAAAGFGEDEHRLNEAVKNLRALLLVKGVDENRRLTVEGLTRSLATARLAKDESADDFHKRFVTFFFRYVVAHEHTTPEDYDALRVEKDNELNALKVAFDLNDWETVQAMASVLVSPSTGLLYVHGYWDEAIRVGTQGMEAARLSNNEGSFAQFAGNIGTIRLMRGEHEEARKSYQQVLATFRELGSDTNVAAALHQLGRLALEQKEFEEAQRLYRESLEIAKKVGNQEGVGKTMHELGRLAQAKGNSDEARLLYNETLEIAKGRGDQGDVARALHQLGVLAHDKGDFDEARLLYQQSLEIKQKLGDQHGIGTSVGQLGLLAEHGDDNTEAVDLFQKALVIFEKLGSPYSEIMRRNLNRVKSKSS